ncbi:MAG: glycosyltransferase [Candidatus Parvarchaeota archaeon]
MKEALQLSSNNIYMGTSEAVNLGDSFVSIIISTHNRKNELFRTIENIIETTDANYEIIVVSANSTDGTDEEILKRFPQVKLVLAPDVGWGEANNIGAKSAKGNYFFFSGPDMQFESGWLGYLLNKIRTIPNCGSIGTVLFREIENKGILITGGSKLPFGYVIHKGIDLSEENYKSYLRSDTIVEVDAVLYPLVPRDIFFAVGGFDPEFFYMCDEMDLGIRIKNSGYRNVVCFGKFMKTDMTKSSDKTFFFWNRNWVRLIIKMDSLFLLPFFLLYPLIRLLYQFITLTLKKDNVRKKLLLDGIRYNIINFSRTHRSKNLRYV